VKPRKSLARTEAEALTLECVCGRRAGVLLRHYQRTQCACGRFYWALRPTERGPMALYAWPGDAMEDKTIQKALRAELEP
jgi:hypothetical protein